MNKPAEVELADHIAELKARRKFAKTIRDSLRLLQDLQAGRLEVLLALFPWVAEKVQSPLYSSELAAFLAELRQVARNGQPMIMPNLSLPPTPEIKVVFNEEEAIQRSILNALAALDEF